MVCVACLGAVILHGDVCALLTFGIMSEVVGNSIIAFCFGMIWVLLLPDWNAFGQATWGMTVLATILFAIYSFMVTAFTPLNTISFVIALDFFIIEVLAL